MLNSFELLGVWEAEFTIASLEIASRNMFAVKGLDCRKAGREAHAQSGRVVVDSQSMTHVCITKRRNLIIGVAG